MSQIGFHADGGDLVAYRNMVKGYIAYQERMYPILNTYEPTVIEFPVSPKLSLANEAKLNTIKFTRVQFNLESGILIESDPFSGSKHWSHRETIRAWYNKDLFNHYIAELQMMTALAEVVIKDING